MKKYLPIIFLVVLILFPFSYHPLKNLFLIISRPFLIILETSGNFLENSIETIRSIRNLTEENKLLIQEIRKLQSEKTALVEQGKENEFLKKQLGFIQENKNLDLVPSFVIGRGPNSFLQYLILNRGKNDGLKGGEVVVSEKMLIGRIVEVNSFTAKVFLITNPTEAISALTQESRAAGLSKGEIGYGLILENIPKEINLIRGENVITSGLEGEFPKGLLIGKIEKITSSPAELFQKASLKPFLDFSKLEIVFIVRKN